MFYDKIDFIFESCSPVHRVEVAQHLEQENIFKLINLKTKNTGFINLVVQNVGNKVNVMKSFSNIRQIEMETHKNKKDKKCEQEEK